MKSWGAPMGYSVGYPDYLKVQIWNYVQSATQRRTVVEIALQYKHDTIKSTQHPSIVDVFLSSTDVA